MLTKTLFGVNWGGAVIVLLLISNSLKSQGLCLPELVEFEIVKVIPKTPWRANYTSLNSPGAFHAFYHVNLKAKSGNLPTQIPIRELSFNGLIQVNHFTSRINRALTVELMGASTPGLTNLGQFLNLDDLEIGEVNWEILSGTGCPTQEPPVQITLPANTTSIRLFTIVVDAAPGDFLKWDSYSGWFDDCMDCAGNIFVNAAGGNTNINFPQPAISNSPLQLTFESIDGSLFNPPIIRVKAQSPPASGFGKMDGVIHIVPSMTPASLNFVIQELTTLGGPALIDKQVRKNTDGSFDVYFSFQDFQPSPTTNPVLLFDLEMLGVFNQSQGGFINCSLTTGRWTIFPLNVNPVTNRLNSVPGLFNLPGSSICSPPITIIGDFYHNLQDCSSGIRFVFHHDNPEPVSMNALTFEFLFSIPLSDYATPGTITSTVPHAATHGALVSGPGVYAYQYDYTGQLNLADGDYVDIPFEVTRGCLDYAVSRGEGIITGGSLCAFEVELGKPLCSPKVKGRVLFDDGAKVQNYRVRVESINNPNYELESALNCQEDFSFCPDNVQAPFRLRLLQALNPEYLDGLTTYDCVLISKHILSIQPIINPYQLIAANAYENGAMNGQGEVIDKQDVSNIRLCILGTQANFGTYSSPAWRYVSDQVQLPNDPVQGQNPVYMTANVVDVPTNGLPLGYGSFKAIKMGDVNRSANMVCGFQPVEKQGHGSANFMIEDTMFSKNETSVLVPVTLNAPVDAIAAQLGFRFDFHALKLKTIHPNPALPIHNIHFGRLNEQAGEIRFAWDSPDAFTLLPKNDWLFTLEFERIGPYSGDFTSLIWSSDNVLPGRVYDDNGNEYFSELQTTLERSEENDKIGAVVVPNPFQDAIVAYVFSKNAGNARANIFDCQGRQLLSQDVALNAGENMLEMSVDPSVSPGIYFLIIETEHDRLIRRITKI